MEFTMAQAQSGTLIGTGMTADVSNLYNLCCTVVYMLLSTHLDQGRGMPCSMQGAHLLGHGLVAVLGQEAEQGLPFVQIRALF